MKILLIKPREGSPNEPLGLMYLAAYIRKYGEREVKIKILDMSARIDLKGKEKNFLKSGYTDDMLAAEVKEFAPDLVGISSMFSIYSEGAHGVARVVKRVKRDILVVVGGAHASALPHWVIEDENIDVVVKGEGEETLLEIVNFLKEKKDISRINGVVIKKDGNILENPSRSFIRNLDIIPFPARDLVDMNAYLYERYNYTHSMTPPRAGVITSRGCPYRCPYCSIHSLWRHTYRMRKPEDVVDEIEYLVNNYRIKEIAFWDDNISLNRKRMIGICDEIIRRRIKIKWCTQNGILISTLDKEVLVKMKKSGCYKLTFGIETASSNTQKFIRKEHIDLEKSKELIRYCNKIGIWTHSSFIIGFPYETEKDIMQTIDYAVSCDVDMATFLIATPYPGTELYDIYQQEGLLPDLYNGRFRRWSNKRPMFHTKNFTIQQLTDYLSLAKRKVYINRALNLIKVLHKIMGKYEFKYFTRQLFWYSKRLYETLSSKN